ncbi:MAG: UdgX family uracil-DNA binding protein [Burkholderiaceae bacterium]
MTAELRVGVDGTHAVELSSEIDLDGFRRAARALIAGAVTPDRVRWRIAGAATADLFDAVEGTPGDAAGCNGIRIDDPTSPPLVVPRPFVKLAEAVALHIDPDRFALLYQLLWRLQHESALRGDALDPQWLQADAMAHAVRRDQHKMTAFVRFRRIDRGAALAPLFVCWYEPDHHIVEATAPFFARRFAQMHWSILTPRRSVSWDGASLHVADGATRDAAPAPDAGESLWLTYYRHIFNPARLKLAMMRKEMPVRYWKNLPEATLIGPLTAAAHQRSGAMIAQQPTEPLRTIRRLPASNTALTGAETAAELVPLPAAGASVAERTHALERTRSAARNCTQCPLYQHATQAVVGEGAVDVALMFVGEQPGDQEDLRGKPFVGPAGQLLAKALDEIGVERGGTYVTNAVKHFKFEMRGKRRIHKSPAQREAAACLDWLEREIALVRPRAIVALGATAARSVLGRPVAVLRERGVWQRRADGTPVLVTLHPSALLRAPPDQREQGYADWLLDLRMAAERE